MKNKETRRGILDLVVSRLSGSNAWREREEFQLKKASPTQPVRSEPLYSWIFINSSPPRFNLERMLDQDASKLMFFKGTPILVTFLVAPTREQINRSFSFKCVVEHGQWAKSWTSGGTEFENLSRTRKPKSGTKKRFYQKRVLSTRIIPRLHDISFISEIIRQSEKGSRRVKCLKITIESRDRLLNRMTSYFSSRFSRWKETAPR